MKIRDQETKQAFIKYLKHAPTMRFGQAVVNFIGSEYFEEDTDLYYMEFDSEFKIKK
jgi:hypothetical protein